MEDDTHNVCGRTGAVMASSRMTARKAIGIVAIVCGFLGLAFLYAYQYWFILRNPDVACLELPLPQDADLGSIGGTATWIPLGVSCTYVTSLGQAQTLQAGWGLTVIAVIALLLVVLGFLTQFRRSRSLSTRSESFGPR